MTIRTDTRNEARRLAELNALGILDSLPEERYDRLTRLAKRAFNVAFATFSLIDEKREWFKSRQGITESSFPRAGSFSAAAALAGSIQITQDASRDPAFAAMARDRGIKFYASCPVKSYRGIVLGALSIADTTPRGFSDADRACLTDLASMIEEELAIQTITTIDDLTKLFNRHGFYGIGEHAIAICKRLRKPATIIYLDLDDFDQVTSEYGAEESNKVLKNIGALLQSNFRHSDIIARTGDDEFCVLLTGTGTQQLDRPLLSLSESIKLQNDQTPYKISYSVGVTDCGQQHDSIADLLSDQSQKKRPGVIGTRYIGNLWHEA